MRLLQTKPEPDRLRDTAGDSLSVLTGGLDKGKLLKGALIAGGVAALTAGSAAISSIRRRTGETDS